MANPEHVEILKSGVDEWNRFVLSQPLEFAANLTRLDLTDTSPIGISFSGANFSFSDLRQSKFNGSDLKFATFVGAELASASFAQSYRGGGEFGQTDLRNVDLRGANLTDSDFSNALVDGANVSSIRPIGGASGMLRTVLSQSKGLTQSQLNSMIGDSGTRIPDHLKRPAQWPEIDLLEDDPVPPKAIQQIDLTTLDPNKITAIWVHVDKLNRLRRDTLPERERHLLQETEVIKRRAALADLMAEVVAGLGGNMAETTQTSLTRLSTLLSDTADFDPYAIQLRMRGLPAIIAQFEAELSDAALIEHLRNIYGEWEELRPLFNEVNRPFTRSPEELEGMVAAYAALRDWLADTPEDMCDPRIKTAMIELVQGLEAVDQTRMVQDRVELSPTDAILIGGALETLPVLIQALTILGQRVRSGQADYWSESYKGAGLERLKTTLDWAMRMDWAGVRGFEVFELLMRLLFGGGVGCPPKWVKTYC